jgi:hypothetical protein
MNKLKPCPCCGDIAEEFEHEYLDGPDFGISCTSPNCGVEIRGDSAEGVMQIWNRRSTDTLVEAVRAYRDNWYDWKAEKRDPDTDAILRSDQNCLRQAMFAELAKQGGGYDSR